MKAPPLVWKVLRQQYGSGWVLFAGPFRVAKVIYDGTVPKGDDRKFGVHVSLPGAERLPHCVHSEIARDMAEGAVISWFSQLPDAP